MYSLFSHSWLNLIYSLGFYPLNTITITYMFYRVPYFWFMRGGCRVQGKVLLDLTKSLFGQKQQRHTNIKLLRFMGLRPCILNKTVQIFFCSSRIEYVTSICYGILSSKTTGRPPLRCHANKWADNVDCL